MPGGIHIIGGCQVRVADFDPVRKEEINATSLFGAGWIDLISEKAIMHNASGRMWGEVGRNLRGDFEGVPVGRVRRLPDGRIGKFGWKAQFATLEEFVAAACANELGLSNPMFDQPTPLAARDHKPAGYDMTLKQVRQLSDFVATLPRPVQVMPEEPRDRRMVQRGEELFTSIGCARCHTPSLDGVEAIYSDLLLHNVTDPRGGGGEYEGVPVAADPLPPSHPQPDEWRTPPLWGVAGQRALFPRWRISDASRRDHPPRRSGEKREAGIGASIRRRARCAAAIPQVT